jgi:39-S ribosomal protein L47 (MRP-L47)
LHLDDKQYASSDLCIEPKLLASGLSAYFINRSSPQFSNYGRAWRCDELRVKHFDELHKLWWVLLRERNSLLVTKNDAKASGSIWRGQPLIFKVQSPILPPQIDLSLAHIKTVLTERLKAYKEARGILERKNAGILASEADEIIEEESRKKAMISESRHGYRRKANYIARRPALLT